MALEESAALVGPELGLFVGGSTAWKWANVAALGEIARRTGAYLHVGRVNSQRRIGACIDAGAHSCDGTSPTRFSVNAAPLGGATHSAPQMALAFGEGA
jgi:hypothetical protein